MEPDDKSPIIYLKNKGKSQGKGKAPSDPEGRGKSSEQRSRSPIVHLADLKGEGKGKGEEERQATGKAGQKGIFAEERIQEMAQAFVRAELLSDLVYGRKGQETQKGKNEKGKQPLGKGSQEINFWPSGWYS